MFVFVYGHFLRTEGVGTVTMGCHVPLNLGQNTRIWLSLRFVALLDLSE